MKDDKLIKDNVIGTSSNLPTPTTSPLIEGIIESFDKEFSDLIKTGDNNEYTIRRVNAKYEPENIKQFLLSSLQKVEQSTIERCLKLFPELVIPKKVGRPRKVHEHSMRITKVLLWSQQDIVSAIKKEFKRE